jgi:hypothetical protein
MPPRTPTPYHILRLDDGAPPPLGTCYASASGQSGTRSRFADWPWEPLATRHKLGARLLAMIPVTLLPLPAAILTSNGLPNRIFPAEAVEPLATRTACPGWGALSAAKFEPRTLGELFANSNSEKSQMPIGVKRGEWTLLASQVEGLSAKPEPKSCWFEI